MTPQKVQITHGHHAGQTGVWLHSFRGVPMIRLSDTVGIPVHHAHFEVLGEAEPAPIPKKKGAFFASKENRTESVHENEPQAA